MSFTLTAWRNVQRMVLNMIGGSPLVGPQPPGSNLTGQSVVLKAGAGDGTGRGGQLNAQGGQGGASGGGGTNSQGGNAFFAGGDASGGVASGATAPGGDGNFRGGMGAGAGRGGRAIVAGEAGGTTGGVGDTLIGGTAAGVGTGKDGGRTILTTGAGDGAGVRPLVEIFAGGAVPSDVHLLTATCIAFQYNQPNGTLVVWVNDGGTLRTLVLGTPA